MAMDCLADASDSGDSCDRRPGSNDAGIASHLCGSHAYRDLCDLVVDERALSLEECTRGGEVAAAHERRRNSSCWNPTLPCVLLS